MARKFLYIVAAITVLVIAAMFALRIWSSQLSELAFVPDAEFTPRPKVESGAYAGYERWIARPGMGANDPAMWVPPGLEEDADALAVPVFFVHPTSYFEKAQWNAPDSDAKSRQLAEMFVRGMASPFNKSIDVWAPRYRQATIGAFLTDKPEGDACARSCLWRRARRLRPVHRHGRSEEADGARRAQPGRIPSAPPAARPRGGHAAGEACGGGLPDRLADRGGAGPAPDRPCRLRLARADPLHRLMA